MSKKRRRPQGGRVTPRQAVRPAAPQVPSVVAQVTSITERSQAFSGPIPSPEMLADYEARFPGFAERIIRTVEIPLEMAQEQQVHRHGLENKVISSDIQRSWAGMILGFLLSAAAIVGGIVLILNDKSVEGLAAIIAALGTLAGVFVVTDQRRRAQVSAQRPES